MSKRTKRERRLERAAREAEKKSQAELLIDMAGAEQRAETPASAEPEAEPTAWDDSSAEATVVEASAPEPSPATPVEEPPPPQPAPAAVVSGPPPLGEHETVGPPRSRFVTYEPLPFSFDDEEERSSPVEFELVIQEERPKKASRTDGKTSRVRVDEEPEKDLEASAELLGRARELVRDGRIEEAMELYRVIVYDHPQSLKARNNLGVLYDELGQHERALEQFEMARGLSPDNVEVLSNLGSALLGLSRFEDAERELRRALKIDPESVEVRANLGILYHRRGQYVQAETELRWVCERDHDHGPAHFYRGEALNRLGRVDQALDVLERAMRLQPSNYKIYHMMGILFDKKHMPVEAAQMYKKMRELRS